MSVEPSEVANELWTRWQGHLINGVFPLGRYLGCSDHSGVFLTKSAAHPSELAIKLVPTNRALAESLLPRWKRAGGLSHAHLLRLLEWGGCQLDGLPYLYALMEYADQTLTQLLQHRALTDEEAQEMLLPALDALTFLHGRNLVQGQLKPANILVVGDQLKLASDTVRRVSEGSISTKAPTAYDPPEARHGSYSVAGDVWGLGVTLFEALTRLPPSLQSESGEATALPSDFPAPFRDIVSRCLSPGPEDRPSVSELTLRARGRSSAPAPAATSPSVLLAPLEPSTPRPSTEPATPGSSTPASGTSESNTPAPTPQTESGPPTPTVASAPSTAQPLITRSLLTVILAGAATLVLGWTGLNVLRAHRIPGPAAAAPTPTRVPPPPSVQAAAGSQSDATSTAAQAAAQADPPVPAAPTTPAGPSDVATSPPGLHEVVPDVPVNARRTIRGHIIVAVRVTVGADGSVSDATVDRAGPSRYFQRLALDASRQWTFPPVDKPSRRLMQVRFSFSRDGTTAHAISIR